MAEATVTGANAQGLDVATARLRRADRWVLSASSRVSRLEALLAEAKRDLARSKQASDAAAQGKPVAALDTCIGSRIDACEPHGAEVHVLIGERWCTVEGVSSMTFGTMGLVLIIDQYRAVHRVFFPSNDPTAPFAWRFMIGGELLEGYSLVPLEPWEWRAPCVASVQIAALTAQVPPA